VWSICLKYVSCITRGYLFCVLTYELLTHLLFTVIFHGCLPPFQCSVLFCSWIMLYSQRHLSPTFRLSGDTNKPFVLVSLVHIPPSVCRSFLWKLPLVESDFHSRSAPLMFRNAFSIIQCYGWWSSGEEKLSIHSFLLQLAEMFSLCSYVRYAEAAPLLFNKQFKICIGMLEHWTP
jgi:hypothetical protein